MVGLKEFLETFGNLTLSKLVYIVMSIVFLILVYRKVSEYLYKRYDAEKQKDQQLKDALEAVKQYPAYRKQSLEMQKRLSGEIEEIRASLEKNTKRLEKMEENSRKRELNKLRETLLQNYKYYTDPKKNPLQAWTRMESEAFWDLFDDYENLGGNGYMHSEVQPKMQLLTVIDMNDHEGITELMCNRK